MNTRFYTIRNPLVFGLISIFLCVFASCDISSSLFSSSEKSELYDIAASQRGAGISDGAILFPGASIKLAAKILNGTESSLSGLSFEILKKADAGTLQDSSADASKGVAAGGLSLNAARKVFSVSFSAKERSLPRSFEASFSQTVLVADFVEALPEVKIPEDITPGTYQISLILYDKAGPVAEKTLDVFFVSGEYSVRGISVYPPSIDPGTFAVLKAQMNYPEGSDPYLVWRGDGSTIAYGHLSEGFDQTLWSVPSREGIYTVMLDIYPFPPADSIPYKFGSLGLHAVKIVVARAKEAMLDEFSESEKFLRLFHFWGDFIDSGRAGQKSAPLRIGKPEVKIYGNSYGFAMGKGRGFEFEGLALPAFEGKLQPFTFMTRFQAQEPDIPKILSAPISSSNHGSQTQGEEGGTQGEEGGTGAVQIARSISGSSANNSASSDAASSAPSSGGGASAGESQEAAQEEGETIFSTHTKDGSVSFGVYVEALKSVYAEFVSDGQSIRTDSTIVLDYRPHDLFLSVIPGEGYLDFLWFFDGILITSERKEGRIGFIPAEGKMTVAGEKGFRAIYDELGIFCELDKEGFGHPYGGAFEFSMKKKYRQDLLIAEGFDGTRLREEILASAEILPELGSLALIPKSSVQSLVLPSGMNKPVEISLSFRSETPQAAFVSLYAEEGAAPLASLSLSGELRYATKKIQLLKSEGSIRFVLSISEGKVYIQGDTERKSELGVLPAGRRIYLKIENQGKKQVLLDSFLAVYVIEEDPGSLGKAKQSTPALSLIPRTEKLN